MTDKLYVEFDWTVKKRDVYPTMRLINISTQEEAVRTIKEECESNSWQIEEEDWGLSIDTGEVGFGVRPSDIDRAIAANGWRVDL